MMLCVTHSAYSVLGAESLLEKGADIGQIVAGFLSIIIVASAWLLWRQVKQQARDSRFELIARTTALISTVGRVFIDYPEMRKYFYEDIVPKGTDKQQAAAIAVALASTMDYVASYFEGMDPAVKTAWERYFTDIYTSSPILREQLDKHRGWYGPELRDYFHL